MKKLRDYVPALKYGAKLFSNETIGSGGNDFANIYYVDADNGSDNNTGLTPNEATATIQKAVTLAAAANLISKTGSTVYVKAKYMVAGSTDPVSYAETVIIPAAGGDNMAIVGVSNNRTQGGLPQIKIGSGSTAMITVRAPGVLLANIGINGASSTGGGILLDDDGSTKTAFGVRITNCHFKNCVGSTATDSRTGGAIMWSAQGNAWQVRIDNNRFYKNVGDVVLLGTSGSVPQDVLIEDNVFSGPAANVDCNLYLAAGSGMNGVIIRDNYFTAMPAIGSGSVARFMDLTGCVGLLANNYFATTVDPALTELTFAAAGTGAKVPATVFMAGNKGEVQATGNTSNHAAIGRYA